MACSWIRIHDLSNLKNSLGLWHRRRVDTLMWKGINENKVYSWYIRDSTLR